MKLQITIFIIFFMSSVLSSPVGSRNLGMKKSRRNFATVSVAFEGQTIDEIVKFIQSHRNSKIVFKYKKPVRKQTHLYRWAPLFWFILPYSICERATSKINLLRLNLGFISYFNLWKKYCSLWVKKSNNWLIDSIKLTV